MPKRCAKFVSQYLIPSLNTQRFGKHLKWIDKKNSIFELDWCHKGGPQWTKEEAEVFVEWDKIKGHYQPEDKQYYTKSKQRFRALLYKLTMEGQIKKLKSSNKYKKVYSIGEKKLRKKRKGQKVLNAGNDSSSNDEISFDDDVCIDEMSWKEIPYNNVQANELSDHNYSSRSNSSYIHSDSEDQTFIYEKEFAIPTYLYGSFESSEKKVLVERNYPYNTHVNILDISVPVSKDENSLDDFLENMLSGEDFRNLTVAKTEGQMICDSMYDLPLLTKSVYENLYLAGTNHTNSLTDLSPFIFDNFAYDSSTEDLHMLMQSHKVGDKLVDSGNISVVLSQGLEECGIMK